MHSICKDLKIQTYTRLSSCSMLVTPPKRNPSNPYSWRWLEMVGDWAVQLHAEASLSSSIHHRILESRNRSTSAEMPEQAENMMHKDCTMAHGMLGYTPHIYHSRRAKHAIGPEASTHTSRSALNSTAYYSRRIQPLLLALVTTMPQVL